MKCPRINQELGKLILLEMCQERSINVICLYCLENFHAALNKDKFKGDVSVALTSVATQKDNMFQS